MWAVALSKTLSIATFPNAAGPRAGSTFTRKGEERNA